MTFNSRKFGAHSSQASSLPQQYFGDEASYPSYSHPLYQDYSAAGYDYPYASSYPYQGQSWTTPVYPGSYDGQSPDYVPPWMAQPEPRLSEGDGSNQDFSSSANDFAGSETADSQVATAEAPTPSESVDSPAEVTAHPAPPPVFVPGAKPRNRIQIINPTTREEIVVTPSSTEPSRPPTTSAATAPVLPKRPPPPREGFAPPPEPSIDPVPVPRVSPHYEQPFYPTSSTRGFDTSEEFYVNYDPYQNGHYYPKGMEIPRTYQAHSSYHAMPKKAVPKREQPVAAPVPAKRLTYAKDLLLSLAEYADIPPQSLVQSEIYNPKFVTKSVPQVKGKDSGRKEFGSKKQKKPEGEVSPVRADVRIVKPIIVSNAPPMRPISPVSGTSIASVSTSPEAAYEKLPHRAEVAFTAKEGVQVSSDEVILKRIRGILNKLTLEKYDLLFERLWNEIECAQDGADFLRLVERVIDTVFDVSLDQPSNCHLYADVCHHLRMRIQHSKGEDVAKPVEGAEGGETRQISTTLKEFRRILLNKCQRRFEEGSKHVPPEIPEGASDEEAERIQKEEARFRRRSLGNIRFISELFKRSLLSERIMHFVIKVLLLDTDHADAKHGDLLEVLCLLLTTVGDLLDRAAARQYLDHYFEKLDVIATSHPLTRIRCLVLDVVELRKAGWKNRFVPKEPPTVGSLQHIPSVSDFGSSAPSTPARSPISIGRTSLNSPTAQVSRFRDVPSPHLNRSVVWIPRAPVVTATKLSPTVLKFDNGVAVHPPPSTQLPHAEPTVTPPRNVSIEPPPPMQTPVSSNGLSTTIDASNSTPGANRSPGEQPTQSTSEMQDRSQSFLREWIECQDSGEQPSSVSNPHDDSAEPNYVFYASMIVHAVSQDKYLERAGLPDLFRSFLDAQMVQQEHVVEAFIETVRRCVKTEAWVESPKVWENLSTVVSACILQKVLPCGVMEPICRVFRLSPSVIATESPSSDPEMEPEKIRARRLQARALLKAVAEQCSLDGLDASSLMIGQKSMLLVTQEPSAPRASSPSQSAPSTPPSSVSAPSPESSSEEADEKPVEASAEPGESATEVPASEAVEQPGEPTPTPTTTASNTTETATSESATKAVILAASEEDNNGKTPLSLSELLKVLRV